jgi:ATP-dependent Lhr-like helicase
VPTLGDAEKAVLRHLELRGASFAQEIARATRLGAPAVLTALWNLLWNGLATPDAFRAIRAGPPGTGPRPERRRRYRPATAPLGLGGRWSAFADEDLAEPDQRDEARAQLALARYGVVSRDLARGDWSSLRHALLRLELGGEVVRGYFVEGLAGEQYALPEAVRNLEAGRRGEPPFLVNLCDPATLWGTVLPLARADGARVAATRIPSTWIVTRGGRPLVLAEGHGRELWTLAGWEPASLAGAVRALRDLMDRPLAQRPVRRLEVLAWNGRPIRATEAGDAFVAAGFTPDGPRLSWDGFPGPSKR